MIINLSNINFDGNGGGGGGSYTLPIASANVLGGVKVGSGLSIDSGGTLSSEGGAGNYVIVDALSGITNPVEGMMAYVPSSVKGTISYTKLYIGDFESFTENTEGRAENYIARIHWGDWQEGIDGDEDLLALVVYQSSNNYYWDWENDGNLHIREIERDGNYYKVEYRCVNGEDENGSDSYFEFRPIDNTPFGDYIIKLSDYVSTAETSFDIVEPAATYAYNGSDWVRASDYAYDWGVIEPASSAETAALLSEIRNNIENGTYPSIRYSERILLFEQNNSEFVSFYAAGPDNSQKRISLSDSVFDENGFDGRGVKIDDGQLVNLSVDAWAWLEADYSTGHLSGDYSCISYGNSDIWKVWFRASGDDGTAKAPLKWRNSYNTEIDGEPRPVWVFSADIPFQTANGVEVWNGVWSVLQDDWYSDSAYTHSWTKVSGPYVDQNYPVYSE